jgi:hypothetical protein
VAGLEEQKGGNSGKQYDAFCNRDSVVPNLATNGANSANVENGDH